MKLYTFYTPSHEGLLRDYLLPSLRGQFDVVAHCGPQRCPSAEFRQDGWLETMTEKARHMYRAVADNMGDLVVWADPDIVFFRPSVQRMLDDLGDDDLAAQRNRPSGTDVCAGFYICRANERTLKLFEKVAENTHRFHAVHDQEALNRYKDAVRWKRLPPCYHHIYFSLGTGWDGDERRLEGASLPDDVVMHHACWCVGVENKVRLLEWAKRRARDIR